MHDLVDYVTALYQLHDDVVSNEIRGWSCARNARRYA